VEWAWDTTVNIQYVANLNSVKLRAG
jgi:hypothetical protein